MAKSDISRGIDFKYKANRKIAPYTISYFYPNDSEYKLASFMNSDGYFGYMNEEGLVVIPPIYLEARDFKSFNKSFIKNLSTITNNFLQTKLVSDDDNKEAIDKYIWVIIFIEILNSISYFILVKSLNIKRI